MRNTKSVRNAKSMRKLHLVGVTTDMKGLIFTARKGSKSGGYVIAVDPKLVEAVDEAARRRNGGIPVAPRPAGADTMSGGTSAAPAAPTGAGAPEVGATDGRHQSALSPREMQARLRAGRSIEEVAAEAGVGTEWVGRFAVPILAEQAQVVALARGLTFAKPRLGESALPLGLSVARNLAERGLGVPDDLFDPAWTAYQLHDSVWTVRFRHEARGRAYEANWELDVATGRLIARNRVASDLGYLDPSGRRRSETGAAATGSYDSDPHDDGPDSRPGSAGDRPPRTSRAGSRLASPTRSVVRSSRTSTVPTRARGASRTSGASVAAKRSEPPARASSRSSTEAPRRSPSVSTSSSRGSRSPRPASEKPGTRGDSDGKKGPTVRGGGIRAATAQVASAQVAASRTIVARTVLPAPRPPAMRRGGFDQGASGERRGGDGRASTGPSRDPAYLQGPADTPRRAPSPAITERPGRHEEPEPDSLIDDLLLDTPTERAPTSGAVRSSVREKRQPTQPADDDEFDVPPFRLRPLPDHAAPPSTQAVTRVRSGGPTGLVRTTLGTGGGNAKGGDAGANGERKRASDRREPLRVPSVLSPASGPDRGMPAPRQRSRRLLRRPR